MADFTGIEFTVLNECDTVTVTDTTTYGSDLDEVRYYALQFGYYKITLTEPDGVKQVYTTVEHILAPIANTFTTTKSGLYKVNVIAIPYLFDDTQGMTGMTFVLDDCFYWNGKIYKCISLQPGSLFAQFNTQTFSLAEGYFKEITEEEITSELFLFEYYYMSVCHMDDCVKKQLSTVVCIIKENPCDTVNLCKNPEYRKLIDMLLAWYNLKYNFDTITDENIDKLKNLSDLFNKHCDCKCQ